MFYAFDHVKQIFSYPWLRYCQVATCTSILVLIILSPPNEYHRKWSVFSIHHCQADKVTLSITGAIAFCCVKVSKPAKNGNLLCRIVSMLLATLYSICICAKWREDSLGLSLSDHRTPLTHACSCRRPTDVIMPCLMSLYQAKTWLEFGNFFYTSKIPNF